jgi:hydrogenase expression/formation protein HypC
MDREVAMCLGVPGRIVSIGPDITGMTMARVDFGGISREVCMACVPDAEVGEYVVVHVGFAIAKIDEAQALQVFDYLDRIGELDELEVPQPE